MNRIIKRQVRMSNSTIALTTHTETPKKTTIKSTTTTTTDGNYTEATTNVTTPFEETTTSYPASTTSDTGHKQNPTKDDGNEGAIIGGCIGAVISIVIVIIIIIVIIRRRKKKRSMKEVPKPPPGKDLLDTLHEQHAIRYHRENNAQDQNSQVAKQYANLTPEGETDEQTDPSVGPDGYLKKTKNLLHLGKKHKKHKKKHHQNVKAKTKEVHVRGNDLGSNELPIYTNELSENGKEPVTRTTSVPNNEAPPPPRQSSEYGCSVPYNEAPPPPRQSSEYATGRIPRNSGYQSNEQSVDVTSNDQYVNLSGHQKGDALFDVSPTKTNGNKVTGHSSGERKKKQKNIPVTDTEVTDQPQKIYENINGANYYNLRDNQPKTIERQSTYEDVGEKHGVALQQDDVYEKP